MPPNWDNICKNSEAVMTEKKIEYTHKPDRKEIIAQNEAGDVVGEIEYTGTDQFWSITHRCPPGVSWE